MVNKYIALGKSLTRMIISDVIMVPKENTTQGSTNYV